MKKLLLVFSILFFSVSVIAAPVNLLVFGDSLSSGYRLDVKDSFWKQLDTALKKDGYNVNVINYSRAGETTEGAKSRTKEVIKQNPDGVVLQFGSNDMLRHFSVEKTKQNLQNIITDFDNAGIPVLLVGMEVPVTENAEYRQAMQQMYKDLALENELLLYPFFMKGLWKEDGTHVADKYFLDDKVHPSAAGVAVMVQHIVPVVEQFLHEDIAQEEVKQ